MCALTRILTHSLAFLLTLLFMSSFEIFSFIMVVLKNTDCFFCCMCCVCVVRVWVRALFVCLMCALYECFVRVLCVYVCFMNALGDGGDSVIVEAARLIPC